MFPQQFCKLCHCFLISSFGRVMDSSEYWTLAFFVEWKQRSPCLWGHRSTIYMANGALLHWLKLHFPHPQRYLFFPYFGSVQSESYGPYSSRSPNESRAHNWQRNAACFCVKRRAAAAISSHKQNFTHHGRARWTDAVPTLSLDDSLAHGTSLITVRIIYCGWLLVA